MVRDVSDADSKADADTGIMIAIVPPPEVVKGLALDDGEAPEQLHITLAYLGKTTDYPSPLVQSLTQHITRWAQGQARLEAVVQGAGTFLPAQEGAQHVLWASVDIPGLHRVHADLVDYLTSLGYHPSEDHSFTPHLTLKYQNHHFRFLPKVSRVTFPVNDIWVCIGGRWESVSLSD